MLLPDVVAHGIVDGTVRRVYRRWDVPRAKPGGTQVTRFGMVAIDTVREIPDVSQLTEADALACGEKNLASLVKWLMKRPADRIFEVTVHYAGEDPRLALRVQLPDQDDLLRIDGALDRLDAAKATGPWTRFVL